MIVEPVAATWACVPPASGFLQDCADSATADGALLIFDEVMTGFRVAQGGANSSTA